MNRSRFPGRVPPALAVCLALAGLSPLAAQSRLARADADRFQQKITRIEEFQQELPKRAAPRSQRTSVTEAEVNAYFAFDGRDQIPNGVIDPRLSILGGGRLAGTAVVDLDRVRSQHKSTGFLDPVNYLGGRVPVDATGVLRADGGVARLDLESVRIAGIPVPKVLLQELVSYYSRTARMPGGINHDDPFPLPAGIREIQIGRGEAVIVQ
jgi:hypothetical protein